MIPTNYFDKGWDALILYFVKPFFKSRVIKIFTGTPMVLEPQWDLFNDLKVKVCRYCISKPSSGEPDSIKIFTGMHFKLSFPFSVCEDTNRGLAVVGILANHLALPQFEMHSRTVGSIELLNGIPAVLKTGKAILSPGSYLIAQLVKNIIKEFIIKWNFDVHFQNQNKG